MMPGFSITPVVFEGVAVPSLPAPDESDLHRSFHTSLATAYRAIVAEPRSLGMMGHRPSKLARRFSVKHMVDRTDSLYRSLNADH